MMLRWAGGGGGGGGGGEPSCVVPLAVVTWPELVYRARPLFRYHIAGIFRGRKLLLIGGKI